MEARASARYIRGSAQKARLVIDLVRGKTVNQALALLPFTNKRAAGHVEKVVRSAIANATELATRDNIAVDPDDLWIKEAFVDMGPTKSRYRMRPAPQGRAFRERRHFCHITLVVSSEDNPQEKKGRDAAERKRLARARNERLGASLKPKTSTPPSTVTTNAAAVQTVVADETKSGEAAAKVDETSAVVTSTGAVVEVREEPNVATPDVNLASSDTTSSATETTPTVANPEVASNDASNDFTPKTDAANEAAGQNDEHKGA